MRGLVGRLLTDQPTRDMIHWHLRAAVSELGLKLGVPIETQIVKARTLDPGLVLGRDYDRLQERFAYNFGEAQEWFRIDVGEPVLSVERVRGIWLDQVVWDIAGSDEYVRIEHPRQGVLHIIPPNLNSLVVVTEGFYGPLHTLLNGEYRIPDFWAVDYTTGFLPRAGRPGEIDAILADWVYCVAGSKILSIAGLGRSKGLASTSTGIDGISRSVSLQASAIYGLNSALENVLEKTEKRINWKSLRTAYRGMMVYMY